MRPTIIRWELLRGWAVLVLAACGPVLTANRVAGEDWPQWRGPQATGVAAPGDYATEWTTVQQMIWKYELPGLGASTPIVWNDRIFLTCEKGGQNAILCLNRQGEKQWEKEFGDERPGRNRKASGCNSSPVTDGKYLFVYYKSGDLAGLTLEGEELWHRNLQQDYGEDTLWWDLGTSPVVTEKHVVIACIQSGTSYIAAFDKATGDVAWKVDRDVPAPGESAQSYTTPVVINDGEREVIIVLGADHVTAHDASSGAQLWQVGGLNPRRAQNWRSISSPVVIDGLVIAPYGRGGSLTAIRLGGSGDVTDSHVAWSSSGPAADVPTPVAADGMIYTCTDRGQVAAIDAASGDVKSTVDLPRSRAAISASPVLANGHLYVVNEEGTTYVVSVGDELKVVAENALEDFAVATPIFVDGRIYLRTDKYLHCIGTVDSR